VRWWKVLGLAGFAGVAATGVVLARAERQRRAYTPQEITQRLHARLAEASGADGPQPDPGRDARPAPSRRKLGQLAGIRGWLGRARRIPARLGRAGGRP
jgi:hypothetical protein